MRILRGAAALLALTALVAGIPAALIVFGGNPLPDQPTWPSITGALLRPASDRVLIGLITIAGWIVWAALVASVTAEVLNALPGRRRRRPALRIPGLGAGQKLAAVLIVAVLTMIAVPHTQPAAHAEPTAPNPTATTTTTVAPGAARAPSTVTPAVDPGGNQKPQTVEQPASAPQAREEQSLQRRDHRVHVVKHGEWLWSLAERYLGDGLRWKDIATANPGIDPDRLAVGQRLIIPVPPTPAPATAKRVAPHEGDTVTVRPGDSLSSISHDLYGTSSHWPELYNQNRDEIADPDLIHTGQELELPDRKVLADADHTIHHHRDDRDEVESGDEAGESRDTGADQAGPATPKTAPRVERDASGGAAAEQAEAAAGAKPPATPPPTAASSSAPQPPQSQPEPAATAEAEDTPPVSMAAGVSVGLLLAAGLITALNTRRRRQLHARRPGRRIPTPSAAAADLERDIKTQHQPLQFEHLDTALRGVAAHCRQVGADLPPLVAVRVADDRIDLMLTAPADLTPPAGIETAADGSVWTVHATSMPAVAAIPGLADQTPPYPALVSLGRDADTAHVLIDLEAAAALTVTAQDADTATAAIAAIALELALSPWATDLDLTFAGPLAPGLAESLDHPGVTHVDDIDRVLTGLEHRAGLQRDHLAGDTIGQKRLDPDIADAWAPRVVLFGEQLTPRQAERLGAVVTELPRVAIAAVTTHAALTPWSLTLTDGAADLAPLGLRLTPQLVTSDQYARLLELIATSGTEDTTPAPWWDHEAAEKTEAAAAAAGATVTELTPRDQPPEDLPNNTAAAGRDQPGHEVPGPRPARRPLNLHALINADAITHARPVGAADTSRAADAEPRADTDGWRQLITPPAADRPMLRILGEPDLVGATPPTRYKQRVNEMLLYLLEHPGSTLPRLMDHLHIGRDYAKNVLGTLRKTLGDDPDGNPYLPEMGRQRGYRLHEAVTCDYHHATRLIGAGVNTAPSEALIRILAMVRGTPLYGAEDWAGVAELRADIPSQIADVAHELTTRALTDANIGLARWAAEKGRLANPDEETLLADQLRTEQQAGNRGDVIKLAARISDHAREHGRDLSDTTKEVLRRAAM